MYHATRELTTRRPLCAGEMDKGLQEAKLVERTAVIRFLHADTLPRNAISERRALYRSGFLELLSALDKLSALQRRADDEHTSNLLLQRMHGLVQHCERTKASLDELEGAAGELSSLANPVELNAEGRVERQGEPVSLSSCTKLSECGTCFELTTGIFCHACGQRLRRSTLD